MPEIESVPRALLLGEKFDDVEYLFPSSTEPREP
jgi:hypothetical protein